MKTVWTNGCFDILTAAHCDFLDRCSLLGDKLIVGLNTDDSVSSYKGSNRPYVPFEQRKQILLALRCVDEVVAIPHRYPTSVLADLKPNVVVKSLEYKPETMPEYDTIVGYGGLVVFLACVPEISSTNIIEKIKRTSLDEYKA